MSNVIRGGARLHWKLEGEAWRPPLVLLNSIGTDLHMWDLVAPGLLQKFQVLRMDMRGHGQSTPTEGDYTLEELALDALTVMDAAGIGQAAIVGCSLGGMVAMTLALTAPERVGSLVLACTSAQMDRENWQSRLRIVRENGCAAIADAAMQRFFSPEFRRTHADVVEAVRGKLNRTRRDGYAGCCAAIRDMDLLHRIGAITAPTLVIGGTRDVSTPFEGNGDKIQAAIPGAKAQMLEAAHLSPLEAPDAFVRAVVDFLGHTLPEEPAVQSVEGAYETGLSIRRSVLGDAWVDKALASRTEFNTDFQAMITRHAWNDIWSRPGLDHRTRRLLVIAMTAALGRWEEFRLHVRAGLEQNGFTQDELKEVLMQAAIYAGVPAANTAFAEAGAVIAELHGRKG